MSDERIAELVRPHAVTPEARKILAEMVREASRETAEACAKVCEAVHLDAVKAQGGGSTHYEGKARGAETCASAIRRAVLREQEER